MPFVVNIFRSFQAKVTLLLVGAMMLLVVVSDLALHQFAVSAQFEQLRQGLIALASTATVSLDAAQIAAIPLDRAGADSPAYKAVVATLRQIKARNRDIGFIYILTKTEHAGIWQFVADPDPVSRARKGVTSYPGDKYNATRFPEMLRAWNKPAADRELGVDEWGVMLSGYAPVLEAHGRTIAVLGIDMMAADIYAAQQSLGQRILFMLLIGLLISLAVGVVIARQITRSVRQLTDGIRHVSRGDLHYRVRVGSKDEVGELADSFNRMSLDLSKARDLNRDYFYGVIQSMIRIVEAKDPYTRGHSERVAQYAVTIARRLGLTPAEIEQLHQVCLLHDIGKLGVPDGILNKPGRLTPQEWDMVQPHPVTGEDILRPVIASSRMLSVVRGHHERYDGTGYPDRLKGEAIDLYAQIVSVADAYDAMTSTRAYRTALDTETALGELERGKGSQFSPRVVEALILSIRNNT